MRTLMRKALTPLFLLLVLTAWGCYGNPVIRTPHLDKLPEEGVRFDHAFCTSASCAASRSVILNGKFVSARLNNQIGRIFG